MKALIFRKTGEPASVLELAEIPTPPLAAGEAMVRVLLCPVHPSDLHMMRGRSGHQPNCRPAQTLRVQGLWKRLAQTCKVPRWGPAWFS